MKARHCLFHVDCFRCATCDIVLRKGDLFGMCDHVLYCKMHFELLTASAAREDPHHQPVFFPHNGAAPVGGGGGGGGAAAAAAFPPFGHPPPPHPPPPDAWFAAGDFAMGGGGPGGGPGGSGGPGGDFPYDNNNEPGALLKKRRGRKKRKVETSFAAMNGFLDSSGAFPPGSGLDPASAAAAGAQGAKTKRARTSFKHHQLRIMKAHFQINQNPDSRELKMLSQKTGLDKKVLQVRIVKDIARCNLDKSVALCIRAFTTLTRWLPSGGGRVSPGTATTSAKSPFRSRSLSFFPPSISRSGFKTPVQNGGALRRRTAEVWEVPPRKVEAARRLPLPTPTRSRGRFPAAPPAAVAAATAVAAAAAGLTRPRWVTGRPRLRPTVPEP